MGASREQIAAAAAEANAKYEVSRRQVVDFETTAQVPNPFAISNNDSNRASLLIGIIRCLKGHL
jgi:hypothetical protein